MVCGSIVHYSRFLDRLLQVAEAGKSENERDCFFACLFVCVCVSVCERVCSLSYETRTSTRFRSLFLFHSGISM